MNKQVRAHPEDRNGEMGALLCDGDWKCWVPVETLHDWLVSTKQARTDQRLKEQGGGGEMSNIYDIKEPAS